MFVGWLSHIGELQLIINFKVIASIIYKTFLCMDMLATTLIYMLKNYGIS